MLLQQRAGSKMKRLSKVAIFLVLRGHINFELGEADVDNLNEHQSVSQPAEARGGVERPLK
jgi:hypothetical protein